MNIYCHNCNRQGHISKHCKMTIISSGIIIFRNRPQDGAREYLLICRKDSLGYVDFLRGKYSVLNKNYILNMMTQMTITEKHKLRTATFEAIWADLWGHAVDFSDPQHIRGSGGGSGVCACCALRKPEEMFLRDRFLSLVGGIQSKSDFYNIDSLLEESDHIEIGQTVETAPTYRGCWTDPEWGFPKGRKNYQEKDIQCAVREFEEETGYSGKNIHIIENLMPFEEIFMGSNYKSYKHKYYLAQMKEYDEKLPLFERGEVSQMGWFSLDECLQKIRTYNVEKRRLICNIDAILEKYTLVQL